MNQIFLCLPIPVEDETTTERLIICSRSQSLKVVEWDLSPGNLPLEPTLLSTLSDSLSSSNEALEILFLGGTNSSSRHSLFGAMMPQSLRVLSCI